MILFALLACTDPEPAALAACQALPGLATDAAGLALLEPVLVPAELAILKDAAPTRGLTVVGSEALAALRSQTTCAVTANNSAGSGRWALTLSRTLPTVGVDGTLGEPQEQTLEWQVIDSDGAQVETGLGIADSMRRSIAEALEEKDYARAASSWKAIQRTYGDPLIAVDVAEAVAQEEAWQYRRELDAWVEAVEEPEVVIAVENKGARSIRGAELIVTFTVGEEKVPTAAKLGETEAGQIGRTRLSIPEGAQGKVTVKVERAVF